MQPILLAVLALLAGAEEPTENVTVTGWRAVGHVGYGTTSNVMNSAEAGFIGGGGLGWQTSQVRESGVAHGFRLSLGGMTEPGGGGMPWLGAELLFRLLPPKAERGGYLSFGLGALGYIVLVPGIMVNLDAGLRLPLGDDRWLQVGPTVQARAASVAIINHASMAVGLSCTWERIPLGLN